MQLSMAMDMDGLQQGGQQYSPFAYISSLCSYFWCYTAGSWQLLRPFIAGLLEDRFKRNMLVEQYPELSVTSGKSEDEIKTMEEALKDY